MTHRHPSSKDREAVLSRDNYKCVNCGSAECLTVDHTKPYAFGGPTEFGNLQTLCEKCNSSKGVRDKPGEWTTAPDDGCKLLVSVGDKRGLFSFGKYKYRNKEHAIKTFDYFFKTHREQHITESMVIDRNRVIIRYFIGDSILIGEE